VPGCGHALPGHEIRIADGAGRTLPERRVGRIQFRGPSATAGYYRNPEATAELVDGDWRNTGDLGYLADDELFVTGRDKDLIIRAGHNLHPAELEAAVGDLPGIRKGCVVVFGAPDPRGATERVVVVAETREADPRRRDELRGRIQALAAELIDGPADDVALVPPGAVLKTSSGKLRRAGTRDAYLDGRLGAGTRAVWLQVGRLALRGAAATGRESGGAGGLRAVVVGRGAGRGLRRLARCAGGARRGAPPTCCARARPRRPAPGWGEAAARRRGEPAGRAARAGVQPRQLPGRDRAGRAAAAALCVRRQARIV
jgi:hypothetical protein